MGHITWESGPPRGNFFLQVKWKHLLLVVELLKAKILHYLTVYDDDDDCTL